MTSTALAARTSSALAHAGTDSALWRDVVDLGAAIDRLGELAGSAVVADAAIIFSWQAQWAADGESRPSQEVRYLDQVLALYRALHELGITVDVVSPDADLSGYRLVVAPALYLVTDEQAANLTGYVAAGGHAVVTFFSGIVDEDDRVRTGGYPGAFRDLLGITVEEFFPLAPGRQVALDTGAAASLWTELLRPAGAEVIASYLNGPLPGIPAVTRNAHAAGTAWYLATALEAGALRDLMRTIAQQARVTAIGPESDGSVEVVRRASATASYLFIINHGGMELTLPATGHELITGESVGRVVRVPAGAVRVIREDTAS